MATRLPASDRTREELKALIEGVCPQVRRRRIVEEALEGEASDAVGREYYEHCA